MIYVKRLTVDFAMFTILVLYKIMALISAAGIEITPPWSIHSEFLLSILLPRLVKTATNVRGISPGFDFSPITWKKCHF